MSDKLRAAAQAALAAMSVVRVFVTTEEKIKHPEGTDWYDNIRINLDDSIVNDIKEMNALEAALAEPEQEPELIGYEHHEYRPYGAPGEIRIHAVLKSQYLHPDGSIGGDFQYLIDSYKTEKTTIKLIPLYAAPPRREWVGLTDADFEKEKFVDYNFMSGASFAEAKLREKNG